MVILVLAVPIAVLGYRVIQKNIIRRAERQVRDSIMAAELVYTGEIERIGEALKLGRTLVWDPDKGQVVDDAEANKLLARPYCSP